MRTYCVTQGTHSACSMVIYLGRKSKTEGTDVYAQLIHVAVQWKLIHCKATTFQ